MDNQNYSSTFTPEAIDRGARVLAERNEHDRDQMEDAERMWFLDDARAVLTAAENDPKAARIGPYCAHGFRDEERVCTEPWDGSHISRPIQ